jgi:PAS domain S-box-containing protein
MMAPIPANEQERLAALAAYDLLDTEPEQTFQDLTQLAAHVFQVPMALVVLVDRDRQWFKAKIGIEAKQTSRDVAFCAHTILGTELLLVPDARDDARFATNPLVTSSPFLRFYAGAPLITPDGYALGTFCVLDRVPRTLTSEQCWSLRILADQVMCRIELRHRVWEAEQLYQDVTERVQAMTALQENEERIRLILDSAMDAVVTVDVRGIVIAWNRQAETMFGWSRDEAIGLSFCDLIIPPAFHDAYLRGIRRFVETGDGLALNRRFEITALRRNRQKFTAELSPVPVKTANSYVFTAFLRDITERQQAEEALALALKKAEQASRLKSEFVAGVSHELRTPLNGVIGMTQLLLNTELTPTQRELAETAQTSAESLLGLINDVLDFSRIEAGKLTLEPAPFNLQTVVEEVAEMLAANAEAKALKFIVEYTPGIPRHLIGDAGRIRQILVNLVGNAVKFTPKGYVLVRVACLHLTVERVQIQVSVEDTGIGIAPDNLDRIFEQFTQADASTIRRYGGTGLGLAISRQLAHLMGGTLHVQSAVGAGSAFSLRLSLPMDPDAPWAPAVELHGQRALIVEDHEANRRVLRDYVTYWGGECTCCASTTVFNALQEAAEAGHPYDLTIMGHCFPITDRLRLVRAIKADPNLAQGTLIMLTMMGRPNHFVNLQASYADHLIKATRPSELTGVLLARQQNGPAPVRSSSRRSGMPASNVGIPQPAPSPGVVPRILVVEDNAVNQRVVQLMLEQSGCRADVVANGLEALNVLEHAPYDLILMDCQMPAMDGYEATRQIRYMEQGQRHTPIIALTAGVMQGEREKCLAAGMDDFLSKPILLNDLRSLLQRYILLAEPLPLPEAQQGNTRMPFQISTLTKRIGEDPGLLREFAQLFHEETFRLLAACERAVACGDGTALSHVAHALKGMLLNLEAEPAIALAQSLEQCGQEAGLPNIVPRLTSLEAELSRVTAHLFASIVESTKL